jgi:hypothetical protein
MNAIGFSKCERKIHIDDVHLNNELLNIFRLTDRVTGKLVGSTSEGMCGGIYGNQSHHDYDSLCTVRDIKLYTLRTNNINNPPLLPLHDSEDYAACCFVVEDENFPGYVKLSLAEMKTNSIYLNHFTRMNDGKQYLPNSMMMDYSYKQVKIMRDTFISSELEHSQDICQGIYINGPAHTIDNKEKGLTKQEDTVCCIHYDVWPNSANSFITRRKPNNWPSNSMVENIQSQKCDVVPVGHHDSKNNDIQWRISFPGERSLLLDLTDVQILCYALIKIILREHLNMSQREVVSSFHIKHVIFWCVELCSCQWAYSNYINCANICLTKLIEMIKGRRIPHYIIESRNLFNSKLTEKMSKEIVDVLNKYDTIDVFALNAFERVFKLTNYNNALLKDVALKSTIMACFKAYINTFSGYVCYTSMVNILIT